MKDKKIVRDVLQSSWIITGFKLNKVRNFPQDAKDAKAESSFLERFFGVHKRKAIRFFWVGGVEW